MNKSSSHEESVKNQSGIVRCSRKFRGLLKWRELLWSDEVWGIFRRSVGGTGRAKVTRQEKVPLLQRTARKLQQSQWTEKRGGWTEKRGGWYEKRKRGQQDQLRPACEGPVMIKGVKSSEWNWKDVRASVHFLFKIPASIITFYCDRKAGEALLVKPEGALEAREYILWLRYLSA